MRFDNLSGRLGDLVNIQETARLSGSVGRYIIYYLSLKIITSYLPSMRAVPGEYWREVMTVWTECSGVHTKTTEGQYSPVRLKQARLVSSLLYGTQFSCKF